MDNNVYRDEGFRNRREYLESLADEYGITLSEVAMISDSCGGPNEDFDGLIEALEDYSYWQISHAN